MEERLIAHRQQSDQLQLHLDSQCRNLREDMIKDIRSVGKELALDIVALNKKIDSRSQQQSDKMRLVDQWMHK